MLGGAIVFRARGSRTSTVQNPTLCSKENSILEIKILRIPCPDM